MAKINPAEVIANSKFNRFHFSLLTWCFMIILFDGYDLVVYGTVVPLLIEEWNLDTVYRARRRTCGTRAYSLRPAPKLHERRYGAKKDGH